MSISDHYATYHHASDVIFDLIEAHGKMIAIGNNIEEKQKEIDLWRKIKYDAKQKLEEEILKQFNNG